MAGAALFDSRLVDGRPHLDLDLDALALTPEQVARLTRHEREERVSPPTPRSGAGRTTRPPTTRAGSSQPNPARDTSAATAVLGQAK